MEIERHEIRTEGTPGGELVHRLLAHRTPTSKLAVLFPGARYTSEQPLLHYAGQAALHSGCDLLSLSLGPTTERSLPFAEALALQAEHALAAIESCSCGRQRELLLISKSMGSLVAASVAEHLGDERALHLFLTPLEQAIPRLRAARGIVVLGTADDHFPAAEIPQIAGIAGLRLELVPNAPHSLELPGDYRTSLQILGMVADHAAGLARQLA